MFFKKKKYFKIKIIIWRYLNRYCLTLLSQCYYLISTYCLCKSYLLLFTFFVWSGKFWFFFCSSFQYLSSHCCSTPYKGKYLLRWLHLTTTSSLTSQVLFKACHNTIKIECLNVSGKDLAVKILNFNNFTDKIYKKIDVKTVLWYFCDDKSGWVGVGKNNCFMTCGASASHVKNYFII